jgi:hypothetical protein
MHPFHKQIIDLLNASRHDDFLALVTMNKKFIKIFKNMHSYELLAELEYNIEDEITSTNECIIVYCQILKYARFEFFRYMHYKWPWSPLFKSLLDLKLLIKWRDIQLITDLLYNGAISPHHIINSFDDDDDDDDDDNDDDDDDDDDENSTKPHLSMCYQFMKAAYYHPHVVEYFIDVYRYNDPYLELHISMTHILEYILTTFDPVNDKISAYMYQFRPYILQYDGDICDSLNLNKLLPAQHIKALIAACYGYSEKVLKAIELIGNTWCDAHHDSKYILCKAKLLLEYDEMFGKPNAEDAKLHLALLNWRNSSGRARRRNFKLMAIHIRASKYYKC